MLVSLCLAHPFPEAVGRKGFGPRRRPGGPPRTHNDLWQTGERDPALSPPLNRGPANRADVHNPCILPRGLPPGNHEPPFVNGAFDGKAADGVGEAGREMGNGGGYAPAADRFNVMSFDPLGTASVRLETSCRKRRSTGRAEAATERRARESDE